jgi:hypothetical protein
VQDTLGILLKQQEDIRALRGERLDALLNRARVRGARQSG